MNRFYTLVGLLFIAIFFQSTEAFAAPPNDNCAAATAITIPSGGYGLGTFTSAQSDMTSSTVQATETFAPAIFVAGLDKKSTWYKFSIPTIRAVRVTLSQPGTTITAGDVGFAVYQSNTCLPGNTEISTKLTPIVTFGNTYHPCVPSGDYLIQVSSNINANGPIIISIEISDQTGAAYDHPNQAYAFGVANNYARKIDFNTECQSIEDATEICSAFATPTDYNKSAWFTFTTPAYFDYIDIQLSGTGATSYFPSNNNLATLRKFGYTLYRGNAVVTPISGLTIIDGCDSLQTDGYYAAYKMYKCNDLAVNTTYSIQLFIKKDFGDDVRLGIMTGGAQPTRGPKPVLSGVPAPNAVGVLASSPAGIATAITDVWGCNSLHNNCGPSLPDTLKFNGSNYNLSSFFTFSLTSACAIYFDAYVTQCGPQPLVRVFKQGLTNSCAGLDTANIIGSFVRNQTIDCLQPGNYTVQVSGYDPTQYYGYFTQGTTNGNYEQCLSTNLGTNFQLNMTTYSRKAANKFSLITTGAVDTINRVANVMQPLTPDIPYSSVSDTMGCLNTLQPIDTTCSPLNQKVIYREFKVADSGTVDFSNLTYSYYTPWRYRLYCGDANALAAAQTVFAYPDKVFGLVPKSECLDGSTNCTNRTVCVIPGTYTFTTDGGDGDVGRVDKPVFTFVRTRTLHNSPLTAQDLGSIIDTLGTAGGTIKTDIDAWSCDDNAVPINGYQPCVVGGRPAKKAIYRQFYLKSDALVRIENTGYWYCYAMAYGTKTLFYGKATNGLAGLTPVGGEWNCFPYAAGNTVGCNLLPAGWYTVVSYNQGPSYDSTMRGVNLEGRYNSAVSYRDEYNIKITPTCPGPKFNRPYKASVTGANAPHLIQLVNRANSTPAFPRTDTTYVLPTENFNCTVDTPFTSHPVKACEAGANRVVYYVFRTTQECFLQINAGGYYAQLFDKDVRTDSLQFATLAPIQTCNYGLGFIQFCHFMPGTYTLVIFAKDANICQSVSPSIYIDQTNKYSRFDFAKNAYDFGIVPPDSAWHNGKVGDVNPLNPLRAPSNDIFYCTTGAADSDPTNPVCNTKLNPNVYSTGPNKSLYDSAYPASNGVTRRNLWYTFVVDKPGYVNVKVEPKTPDRLYQQKFSVYQSNVDGTLPFTTVVTNGDVDSTVAQGLTHIATNQQTWYYCSNLYNNVSFYRDPCTSYTTRYYVLVENVNSEPYEAGGTLPNTQTEVSVMIDSINLVLPKHDHYSQAGDFGSVGVGVYQGDIDNYSCATRDATDPFYYYGNYNCQKTLWYKFTPTITGNVRYRINVAGTLKSDYYDVQLFKSISPNDSSITGLQVQYYHGAYGTDGTYWAETCVAPGTYYLMMTGCAQVNAFVFPQIELIEAVGDFCSRAVPSALNGPGAVTTSVLVDCHTIGTDYGEFGPKLTCPQTANTADYKTSWFRMDIGGTDTLDVTTYLVENTNAASGDIKYRLMTGNCGAMQEQSCVLDALTQNTYQCLVPGQSYYVQVFTPIVKFGQPVTGTIDLKLSAVNHADTCVPLTNCLATANFNTLFDCTVDSAVKFVNFSTYGTSIAYKWNFGYNGQTSTAVSPSFFYPALATDQTYTVKLVVENTSCGKKDSVTRTVMVPGRPYVNFGNDISSCDGAPVVLTATSHTGATYVWQDGSIADTFRITATGSNNYSVKVNYNGCSSTDTIKVLISPLSARPLQNIILCTDSVSVSANRNMGETYQWSTGATSASIFVSNPGIYWVDIKYFNCLYRDSFNVNTVLTARPLGNDTTVCISSTGYTLNAETAGAVSYLWQNASTADTLTITAPGQYHVAINFGNCSVSDTVNITGYPAPLTQNNDTAICFGQALTLGGNLVTAAGIYRDTIRYGAGCDSLIRSVTVTINAKPNLGNDTTVCLAQSPFPINATTIAATGYTWQDGSTNPIFNASASGIYWVDVQFGNCSTRDSIAINTFPPPLRDSTDTSICSGASITLPWGAVASVGGTYADTIQSSAGCDSVIHVFILTVVNRPSLGNDTTVAICSGLAFDLSTIYNTTGLIVNWSSNGQPVADSSAITATGIYQIIATNTGGCSDTGLVTVTHSPRPNLGNDSAIAVCQGSSVDLTGLYNTNGFTANWSVANTPVANPAAVNMAGVYQLIAANTSGCSDTALVTLTIASAPNLGNDSSISICAGSVINLYSIYDTIGLTSSWMINNLPVPDPAAVSMGGVYLLSVTNSTGCIDTAVVTLTVNPKPALGNDTTISICPGQTADLTALYSTTGLIASWTKSNQPVVNPAAVSNGIYQLIVINSSGCADTAVVTINFSIKPALGNDTTIGICDGRDVNLTSLYITTGLTSNWTINNSAVADPSSINTAGNYSLIATNNSGCADTAAVTVTINLKPAIGNDTTVSICPGATFDLTSLYNVAGYTPLWTLSNNPVANPTSINSTGNYRLIVTNASGCSDTAIVVLTFNAKPALGNDKLINICRGTGYNLTTAFNATGLTSAWSFNNRPVLDPTSVNVAGAYQLIATNNTGCSDTALITVTFYPKPSLGNDTIVSVCAGNHFNLTTVYATTNLTTNWTINNQPVTNPSSVDVAGTYQLIVSNANGCLDTALVTLTVNPKPSLGNDTTVSICRGATVDLTTLFNTIALTTTWTTNNNPVANPSSVTAARNYRLIVVNSFGCTDTIVVTITFNPKPVLGNDTTINICRGGAFNLAAVYNTTGLVTTWVSNSLPINNSTSITTTGVYTLIAVNNFGCSDTAVVTIGYHPKPNLGNDTSISICQGNSFNLHNVYSTTGLTTAWTLGNNTVTDPSTITMQGVYQLIATNATGCKDTAIVTLTVNPKPNIGRDTAIAICQGRIFNLTTVYNTNGLATNWTLSNNPVANALAVSAAGVYRLIVTSTAGCSDTALLTLTVNLKPNLGRDTAISICQDNTFDLTSVYTTTGNGNVWTKINTVVPNPAAVSTAGVYQLISTNTSGCSDTANVSISVLVNPIVVTNAPALVCPPLTVDLTATAITAGSTTGLVFTYWQDAAATMSYATATAAPNDTYYIKGTNATGCFDIKPVVVSYYQLPIVSAGNDVAICNNDSAILMATVTNVSAPVTYQWEPVAAGIRSPAAASTIVRPPGTQQYTVTVKDTYGCNFSVTDAILVTMQPPVPAFAGNDTNAVIGMPQQLHASGGIRYTWTPSSVLNNANIPNPQATLFADTTRFIVRVEDVAGCIGYDTVIIRAYEGITYYVPNAFSPNDDGNNDVFRPIPVGIAKTELFRIYNRYGQIVFETMQYMKGWDGTYQGKPQPIGNYVWILKGIDRNGKVIELKGNALLIR